MVRALGAHAIEDIGPTLTWAEYQSKPIDYPPRKKEKPHRPRPQGV